MFLPPPPALPNNPGKKTAKVVLLVFEVGATVVLNNPGKNIPNVVLFGVGTGMIVVAVVDSASLPFVSVVVVASGSAVLESCSVSEPSSFNDWRASVVVSSFGAQMHCGLPRDRG